MPALNARAFAQAIQFALQYRRDLLSRHRMLQFVVIKT
jgi:hypothetical protein